MNLKTLIEERSNLLLRLTNQKALAESEIEHIKFYIHQIDLIIEQAREKNFSKKIRANSIENLMISDINFMRDMPGPRRINFRGFREIQAEIDDGEEKIKTVNEFIFGCRFGHALKEKLLSDAIRISINIYRKGMWIGYTPTYIMKTIGWEVVW